MTTSVTTPVSTDEASKVFSPGVVGVALMPPPHGTSVVDFTFYDEQGGVAHEVTPQDNQVIQTAVDRATRGTMLAGVPTWIRPGSKSNLRRLNLNVRVGHDGLSEADLRRLLEAIAQQISARSGYQGARVAL